MKTFAAIYENGVFRPTEPVDLPEHQHVRVTTENGISAEKDSEDIIGRIISECDPNGIPEMTPARLKAQEDLYRILSVSYDTGDETASQRVDEHQP